MDALSEPGRGSSRLRPVRNRRRVAAAESALAEAQAERYAARQAQEIATPSTAYGRVGLLRSLTCLQPGIDSLALVLIKGIDRTRSGERR